MNPGPCAVLDACVLVPMLLADTLLRLAALDMFQPAFVTAFSRGFTSNPCDKCRLAKWTAEIIDEVNRTLTGKARRENAMRRTFAGSWIRGYEELVPSMPNESGDRHVLAAAVRSGRGLIVTSNLRHFPVNVLAPYGVAARSPGDFLLQLYRRQAPAVLASLLDQASAIGITPGYLLRRLAVNAPEFADGLARDIRGGPDKLAMF